MQTRSLKERLLHAVGFEALAILIVSPLAAILMDKPLFQMGAVAVALSTIAMLWNIIYNTLFDRVFPPGKVKRGLKLRIAHAICFEGGFILIGLPVAATILGIGLSQAFMLEVGVFLFFLPYTVVYNWLWDCARKKWQERQACHHS